MIDSETSTTILIFYYSDHEISCTVFTHQLTWHSTCHIRCPSRMTESFLVSPCSQPSPLFESVDWTTPELLTVGIIYYKKAILCNHTVWCGNPLGDVKSNTTGKQTDERANRPFGNRSPCGNLSYWRPDSCQVFKKVKQVQSVIKLKWDKRIKGDRGGCPCGIPGCKKRTFFKGATVGRHIILGDSVEYKILFNQRKTEK